MKSLVTYLLLLVLLSGCTYIMHPSRQEMDAVIRQEMEAIIDEVVIFADMCVVYYDENKKWPVQPEQLKKFLKQKAVGQEWDSELTDDSIDYFFTVNKVSLSVLPDNKLNIFYNQSGKRDVTICLVLKEITNSNDGNRYELSASVDFDFAEGWSVEVPRHEESSTHEASGIYTFKEQVAEVALEIVFRFLIEYAAYKL